MSLVDDIKKNLASPKLNSTQKAIQQKMLAQVQGEKPISSPKPTTKTSQAPASPFISQNTGKVTQQPLKKVDPIGQQMQTTIANKVDSQGKPITSMPAGPSKPVSNQSTQQPAGTQQSTQPSVSMGGFDEKALLDSGISQDQINKAKAILSPVMESQENQLERAGEYKDLVLKDLDEGQKEVEALYSEQKKKKEELTQQALEINDQTAKMQEDLATQEYQKTKFQNEQAQKQYELDQSRNEQELQMKVEEDELAFRRAIGAQLGAAFSSEGIYRYVQVKRQGAQMISDLRSQTAIGKAEFSFKAQEIETKYTDSLKQISNDRRAQSFALLSDLNTQLDEIDSKVLSTKEEKRQAARDAVKAYYEKLDEVDKSTAELTSSAVNSLFEEKKELEKEKLEKESVDTQMSAALGYFANKYGQPIGVREGEAPKPWVGQYDEALSKQFGHLVDAKGNAILGDDGKRINYTNFEKAEYDSLLDGYLNGDIGALGLDGLNGAIGTNNAIKTAKGEGAWGGQCGTFVRTNFTNETRGWPNTIAQKKAWIDKEGFRKKDWVPKVGDVIIQDVGKWGHFAIINSISEDGKTFTLTESNWNLDERVHNTRKISINDKTIYGAYRPELKDNFAMAQPAFTNPSQASDGGNEELFTKLDNVLGSVEEYENMKKTEGGRKMLMEIRAKVGSENLEAWAQNRTTGEGESGTVTIDSKEKTKLQSDPSVKKVKAANELQMALKTYRDMVAQQGDLVTGGVEKAKIEAAYNNLKIQFKNAAELGAITAPDVPLIEGAIKPITKDWYDVAGKVNFANEGGVAGVLTSLDTALGISNEKKEQAIEELKGLYPDYVNSDYFKALFNEKSSTAPSSPYGTGEKATKGKFGGAFPSVWDFGSEPIPAESTEFSSSANTLNDADEYLASLGL